MISYGFRGFPGKGVDGRDGLFDGIARIERTGPDYRGERWVCTEIPSAKRRRDGANIAPNQEIELQNWLAVNEATGKDIDALIEGEDHENQV